MKEEENKSHEIDLSEYRKTLIILSQKSQEEYDTLVVKLAGGALGVSFAFVNNIIRPQPWDYPCLLGLAWIFWGLSLVSSLVSHYSGTLALNKTIDQVDRGMIYSEHPGARWDKLTGFLNGGGMILFISGVVSLTVFVMINIGGS
jgi:hypothetical protein